MNMSLLNNLHIGLKQFKDFELNSINIIRYLYHIEKIVEHKNPSSIPYLFKEFKPEDYVLHVLRNLDILSSNAPEWACTFLFDIFNTPKYQEEFQNNIYLIHTTLLTELLKTADTRLANYPEFLHEFRLRFNSTLKEATHA